MSVTIPQSREVCPEGVPRVPRRAPECQERARGTAGPTGAPGGTRPGPAARASQECHEQRAWPEWPPTDPRPTHDGEYPSLAGRPRLISQPRATASRRGCRSSSRRRRPHALARRRALVYPEFFPCSCYTAKSDGPPPPRISKTLLLRNVFALITRHAARPVPLDGSSALPTGHSQRKTRSVGVRGQERHKYEGIYSLSLTDQNENGVSAHAQGGHFAQPVRYRRMATGTKGPRAMGLDIRPFNSI